MKQKISLRIPAAFASDDFFIRQQIAAETSKKSEDISGFHIIRRSIDARGKQIYFNIQVQAFIGEPFHSREREIFLFKDCSHAKHTVLIVGAGPTGLFAALKALELGIKPIVIERGKDVKARRRDLAVLNREGIVNPDSNYCFGEGGAGTYSDGKLYTRSNKRGSISRILQLFVDFGAEENILFDAHPHIGTNKLPQIITAMRNFIITHGGIVHFETKLVDFDISQGRIKSVKTADGAVLNADAYLLATGHSAKDIFQLLRLKDLLLEAKPFALGVRVEHPQDLINSIQYYAADDSLLLPPASYSVAEQVHGQGVFSFCMCPGGIIAPAATSPGEIVVNGWSPSKRNNPFANSGIVVTISAKDALAALPKGTTDENDPFLFLKFQQMVEQDAFKAGNGELKAPAQRLVDFCEKRFSGSLPQSSYLPGLESALLDQVLPGFLYKILSQGFKRFGKRLRGYYSNEANVVATESRTSSPVRIPRDPAGLHHPQIRNLFPCGEGAGYAGGIVSAAMDGENVMARVVARMNRSD